MSLPAEAAAALQTFQDAAGWEQRARLLMQFGDRLSPLRDADKCDAQSGAWL
jgi:cysteine desulfuration protein SufE